MNLELDAKERGVESIRTIRNGNKIPAVVYKKGEESIPITLDYSEFLAVYKNAGGSSIINLSIGAEKFDVLVRDRQLDNATGRTIHVDFMPVIAGQKVDVTVPLVFTGEPQAVKSGVGILSTPIHELEISCLPKEIPHDIEIDISSLSELHQRITIEDIRLPDSIEHSYDSDTVIATISEIQENTEDEEAPSEIDFESIGSSDDRGKREEVEE